MLWGTAGVRARMTTYKVSGVLTKFEAGEATYKWGGNGADGMPLTGTDVISASSWARTIVTSDGKAIIYDLKPV